ncbi:hypothetical protein MRBLBA71_005424 [Bacillus nitratireducens]|uniref:hypothetical protein n=1 Tax=Bacillus nitratireducens TaxID=2026193 RepID=UPI0034670B4D
MQLKKYTWKSYTFLIVSIFVTINPFLSILERVGVDYVVPFAYFIVTFAVIAIILAVIGLCFTLFNTAIILFFLWFNYHFT